MICKITSARRFSRVSSADGEHIHFVPWTIPDLNEKSYIGCGKHGTRRTGIEGLSHQIKSFTLDPNYSWGKFAGVRSVSGSSVATETNLSTARIRHLKNTMRRTSCEGGFGIMFDGFDLGS